MKARPLSHLTAGLAILAASLLPTTAQAEPDVEIQAHAEASWQSDVRPLLLEQYPALLNALEHAFSIEDAGHGASLDDTFGEFADKTVGPFSFFVTPKSTDNDEIAELVVRFQTLFFDEENQPLLDSDAARASSMKQNFIEWAIRPVQRMDDPVEVEAP